MLLPHRTTVVQRPGWVQRHSLPTLGSRVTPVVRFAPDSPTVAKAEQASSAVGHPFGRWLCTNYLNISSEVSQELGLTASVSPIVVVSNHPSALDVLVLAYVLRTYVQPVKKVVCIAEQLGFVGKLFAALGLVTAVSLPGLQSSGRRSPGLSDVDVEALQGALNNAEQDDLSTESSSSSALLLFPEGSPGGGEGSIRAWRLKVGYLASKLQLPVVPAYVTGTFSTLPESHLVPRRNSIAVALGPDMQPPPEEDSSSEANSPSGAAISKAAGRRTHASTSPSAANAVSGAEASLPKARKQALQKYEAQVKDAIAGLRAERRQRSRQRTPRGGTSATTEDPAMDGLMGDDDMAGESSGPGGASTGNTAAKQAAARAAAVAGHALLVGVLVVLALLDSARVAVQRLLLGLKERVMDAIAGRSGGGGGAGASGAGGSGADEAAGPATAPAIQ